MTDASTQAMLDRQSVMYLMTTLTKTRLDRGIKRQEVADRMGVHVGRIHDFDERKTPWSTITLPFFMQYARAVGLTLGIVIALSPEGSRSDNASTDG